MLRLTSKKTLPILLYILENTAFTQTGIRDRLGISIGRINRVIRFLIDKGIVIKENARYHLIQPNRLAELVAATYEIPEYQTLFVQAGKARIKRLARESGAVLCLESALEAHSRDFSSDTIHIYDNERLRSELVKLPRGKNKVVLYKMPHSFEENAVTGKALTVMDLFAKGKPEFAQQLSEKLWDTRQ